MGTLAQSVDGVRLEKCHLFLKRGKCTLPRFRRRSRHFGRGYRAVVPLRGRD